ncbi:MAG: hypothetical protein CL489_16565 [Acidobacteria bacterium]|nr:hypothetical protein [Acidobacteriota bacterium]|tara:strand:+ start:2860 stop:3270 length:411 start_codon:yes stop_codon:yes gene_type:complete
MKKYELSSPGEPMSPGFGDWSDVLGFVEGLVSTLVPSAIGRFKLEMDENRQRVRIRFKFDQDKHIGLFVGCMHSNLRALGVILRSQQIYPHNRYLRMEIEDSKGNVSAFENRDVSGRRKGRDFDKMIQDQLIKVKD